MKPNYELLQEFIEEAKAHIGALEAGLLRMEEDACDADCVNEMFRAVHSIKGTAGFFELTEIVELSHVIETLFGQLRDQELDINPAMVDALLSVTDVLKELVLNPELSMRCDIAPHVAIVKAFLPAGKRAEPDEAGTDLSAWELWNQLTDLEMQEQQLAAALPAESSRPSPAVSGPLAEAAFSANAAAKPDELSRPGKARAATAGDTVRVSVALLDDLLNMVGEMVLRRNQLLRIAQNTGKDVSQLDVVAQGIDTLTTSLQEKVMKTRMQPVANVFNKFPRIVRELSRKLGKEVELEMAGLGVELDRSIIEALIDPITHLVRNALDHGIEPPQVRAAGSKPPDGKLVLHAYHESGRVIIDIRDDGAGIDIEVIRAKALQKGWVSEKEAELLNESDILNFIMRPGFSTAQEVTDLSGRGVGLDVVKTNIEKLGGKVELFTTMGAGTTFRLILPLTLAIISSFIVEVAGSAFALPQANVKELILIQPGEMSEKRIEFIHTCPVLRLRNRLLPLVRLADVLDIDAGTDDDSEDRVAYFADKNRTFRILVIKSGHLHYGLVVDAVYDTEEILVKPVPAALKACGCYSGVTVLGDGRIAMIIDPESLRLEANLCQVEEAAKPAEVHPADKSALSEQQSLLLFKASGGEILGVDLAMVSRVEEVALTCIQKIGSRHYFIFRDQPIRVIRPEHYLPIARRKNKLAKVYVILPKFVRHPVGIIAEEICDAISTSVQLDITGVNSDGIIGTTVVDGAIVTLLNIHELLQKAAPEYYPQKTVEERKGFRELSGEKSPVKKAVILLAEDTPFFARTIKSYLENEDYTVITVENGCEALEVLGRQTVDVVISDIEMPHMNGLELVRTIRSSETLRHLPVIALTSLGSDADKERGLRAGFDHYEVKLDRARLLESVAQVLNNKE